MADHGNKCYVPGCAGNVTTFHTLPSEKTCQQAWLMFIYNRIPQQFNSRLLVCSAHFTSDAFANLGQFQAGFSQRLYLKKGAIPTLIAPAVSSDFINDNLHCYLDPAQHHSTVTYCKLQVTS